MGVDAKWGRFPICPEMSRFVPVCPLLSRFVPVPGPKKDKRGQTGTKRDISGQIGKRPHSSPQIKFARNSKRVIVIDFPGKGKLSPLPPIPHPFKKASFISAIIFPSLIWVGSPFTRQEQHTLHVCGKGHSLGFALIVDSLGCASCPPGLAAQADLCFTNTLFLQNWGFYEFSFF